jgi:hypothetical protein
MTEEIEELELKQRLSMIESMIAEGRRTTESWGWTFVLWGVAYYIAIAWSTLAQFGLAWPITMVAACVLMAFLIGRKRSRGGGGPVTTTIGRAIRSIWIASGISMFVLLDALGFSSRAEWHVAVAVAATLVGTANAASSLILKWKLQFVCAMVWWAAAVVACFGSDRQCGIASLLAIFFCQIVFGIYGMIAESRQRRANSAGKDPSHA